MRQRIGTTRLIFLIGFAACAMVSSCKKSGPDVSTPKKAAIAFFRAAQAGDVETMRQLGAGTDAEFALAKAVGQEVQSTAHFLAAGVEKFGDVDKSKNLSLDLVAEFEADNETVDGDTATLTSKDSNIQPTLLKKTADGWKVDLSYLDKDDSARQQSEKMPQAAKIWDDTAQEIQDGKYRSFAEALGTARGKIRRILLTKQEQDMLKAQADIHAVSLALDAYKADVGEYPPSLDALEKPPANAANWKGPYSTDGTAADPWGHVYIYLQPGKYNTGSFDLHSMGPDGQDNTADDITNWNANTLPE